MIPLNILRITYESKKILVKLTVPNLNLAVYQYFSLIISRKAF